jgi:dihydropteroate synthase
LSLPAGAALMGILNVTPDSFSDGGRYLWIEDAVRQAHLMVDEGADLIDVGGESTRPGSESVTVEVELKRIIPLIRQLSREVSVPISVDTSKPEVMKAAVEAGAAMINDIWALRRPGALEQARALDVPVCLMHMKGIPATMQQAPDYIDVVHEVKTFLQQRVDRCLAAGISSEKIVVDPGIGFGKRPEHNRRLIDEIGELQELGQPVLVGISRKSFLPSKVIGPDRDRLCAQYAAQAVVNVASLIRVHNVGMTAQVLKETRMAV